MISSAIARWTIWGICAAATAGVVGRPFKLPEAIWAVAGASLLILLGFMPADRAGTAVMKGADVYFFLIGMMLLSETARVEGLFDWVAERAVATANGSASALFAMVFGVGIVVTALLSNDATAVVLTPAVFAAARRANVDPRPFLFACALVANAASFVLPISNPANLVLYGGHMPPLSDWLASFSLPSILAIAVTFCALRWVERIRLSVTYLLPAAETKLTRGGFIALFGIVSTAIILLMVSALDRPLGIPTCLAGVATVCVVCAAGRKSPSQIMRDVSWSVLPLVASLFVLVEALVGTGAIDVLAGTIDTGAAQSLQWTAAISGALLALASNAINNLPAGLIASSALAQASSHKLMTDALLIGVDLGPNLSITGSLATILWLQAIRREGEDVSYAQFLKIGAVTMPIALLAALGARVAIG